MRHACPTRTRLLGIYQFQQASRYSSPTGALLAQTLGTSI
jgi:hypothetical protein